MSQTTRRVIFAVLVFSTIGYLTYLMASMFAVDGINIIEFLLLLCFWITLPWTVIGFWNAVIGFALLRLTKNPAEHVYPGLSAASADTEIKTRTALAMCIRNEDVDQVFRNINAMIARLVASGQADRFHVFLLSDSSIDELIAQEAQVFERLQKRWHGKMEITYRLRTDNAGYKAGNIRDFCERWGNDFDYMLTLDADSVMSASSMLRMVRIMQKNPNLGILQSLVVGLPSESAFTRVFQLGMRLGMKSYTLGSAWWQADCGPYWGHNALIRIRPFIDHCHLPKLAGDGPLSGWILSHDQVEAVYMRRAGYECRVMAEEGGSYEENPPHILEFIRRDLRWCHGNMQYFKLMGEKGLHPTSRVQLALAILMFISAPAWMLFVVLATFGFAFSQMGWSISFSEEGYTLFAIIMLMVFAPKLTSFFDALLRPDLRVQYGGAVRMLAGGITEVVFSMMLAPIMAISNTVFLFRLFVLKKAKGWIAQSRSVEALPIMTVGRLLWPQMIFGIVGFSILFSVVNLDIVTLLICLPVFVGPLFAIAFGVSSSNPAIGALAARLGLWQIPEEASPAIIVRALNLEALTIRERADDESNDFGPLTTEQLLAIDVEAENQQVAIPKLG